MQEVLRGKFIAVNAYIEKSSQINNLNLRLKKIKEVYEKNTEFLEFLLYFF